MVVAVSARSRVGRHVHEFLTWASSQHGIVLTSELKIHSRILVLDVVVAEAASANIRMLIDGASSNDDGI